ncbi:SigE family RNA polymerase sigma factor [Mumia zhuanghuii]|jgi:RNA polymerase sigma-70 factor (sigma-E family)|uniref:SigE family RNA polymerase sigma factor n=1 Tax=Mumia zhuanghuii TaxID=2585211 RepID=A0A5C4MQ86_9ACTN|nr:SigE family RNA polymerase sigma factor [Mumia zhuanghuii]TNC46214.1 SigE family RNA polymerase sigma factor [Mumia zhuanghuii]TNC46369.1 SigE family RNA polymerase sigma factor [Mumia zhuanghuii]
MTDLERQADADAFVREHATWLTRLAYLLVGSREDALDLAQETCARMWRSWPSVSSADDPLAYVATIMANLQRSRWRRRTVHEVPYEQEWHAGSPAGLAFEEVDALRRGLDALSDRQRRAIVLRYWVDLDDAAIAQALACRPATVRSLLSRGIARLREDLTDPFEETTS